jgi:hypothetical protein
MIGHLSHASVAQRRHRHLFAGAVAIGSGVIVVLMTLGARTALVAFWAVAVVIALGAALSLVPLPQVSDQQKGDAVNHLGFILALVMLALCLAHYDPRGGDVTPVLRGFAASVASIAAGFTLKVLFQQFQESPEEIEERVRVGLARVSRELHVHALHIVQDLGTFRAMLAAEIGQPGSSMFTVLAQRTQSTLEQMLMTHVEAVTAISRRQHDRAGEMASGSAPSAAELQVLAERLSQIGDEMQRLIHKGPSA